MSLRALALESVLKRVISHGADDSVRAEIERRRREGVPTPARVPARVSSRFSVTESLVRGSKVVRLADPARARPRAMIFLPGGGYAHPIRASHWAAIARLARRAGVDAIVPHYDVAPAGDADRAHRFVAAVLADAVAEYGREDVIIAGDSAGAGLALSVLQRHPHDVAAAVLLSPWLDVELAHPAASVLQEWDVILRVDELREWGRAWAGPLSTSDPAVSPLRGGFDGLPPVHLITGGRDLLMPDALEAYRFLRAAGNTGTLTYAPDGNHAVGLMGPTTPEAKRAERAIVAALGSSSGTRKGAPG
jgi:acetyl esterase/lipase